VSAEPHRVAQQPRIGIAVLWVAFIAADAAAQMLFKSAAAHLPDPSLGLSWLYATVTSPRIWAALACLGLTFGSWMLILRRGPLATAFPMTAATYIVVVVASRILYGETIAPVQYLGIGLIVVGVALMRPAR
jgi:drug/metabolite transporter (DMT)-like permease